MYGIGKHAEDSTSTFAAWRSIALFLGASTVVCAGLCFWLLGTPNEVWWLSKEEKVMANGASLPPRVVV
jgi:ACS family allantoate permease-like MFS transporter